MFSCTPYHSSSQCICWFQSELSLEGLLPGVIRIPITLAISFSGQPAPPSRKWLSSRIIRLHAALMMLMDLGELALISSK